MDKIPKGEPSRLRDEIKVDVEPSQEYDQDSEKMPIINPKYSKDYNATSDAQSKDNISTLSNAKNMNLTQKKSSKEVNELDYGEYVDPEAAKSLVESNKLERICEPQGLTNIAEKEVDPPKPKDSAIEQQQEERNGPPIETFFKKIILDGGLKNHPDLTNGAVSALSQLICKKSSNRNKFNDYAAYVNFTV